LEIYNFLKKICNQKPDSYFKTFNDVSNQIISNLVQNIKEKMEKLKIPEKMDLSYYLIAQNFFMKNYISSFIDQAKV
jgi:hypothetical protein